LAESKVPEESLRQSRQSLLVLPRGEVRQEVLTHILGNVLPDVRVEERPLPNGLERNDPNREKNLFA